MTLFIIAIALQSASAAFAFLSRRGSLFWDRFSLLLGFAGVFCGLAAAILCIGHPGQVEIDLPWSSFDARLLLRLDSLSALFLLPNFFVTGAGLLYGTGYWPFGEKNGSSAWIRFFYPLLSAGIALVLAAGNGLIFLIGWEIMALAGYFLVVTERENDEARQAGILYLAATHTGSLVLFAMFSLLGEHACLSALPLTGTLIMMPAKAAVVFLLALFGFGFKAGIFPLHIWLPRAHSAAPSHVSALMSGVMIKTGIYGILRISTLFATIPPWWGWLILVQGVSSGLLGVLFAIAQHDIKRLLAYHSVENIGIILIGIGIGMLGMSYQMPVVAALGMTGALLHVINHGLFKGLLFLSAGSMIHATATRQMSNYGGLLKKMPLTGLFFLGGAVAICGLPPLNGFVSEWFIYLALFKGGLNQPGQLIGALPALVIGLPIIGGLALLCFTKVFGLSFLGTPRVKHRPLQEAPISMLTGMGLLLIACVWIGLLPATMLPMLAKAVGICIGQPDDKVFLLTSFAPTSSISVVAFILVALLAFFWWLSRRCGDKKRKMPCQPTWGCGYAVSLPRAQYSTSSFAEIIMKLFDWVLHTRFHTDKIKELLPGKTFFSTQTPDLILDIAVMPCASLVVRISNWIRRFLQHGVIGIYLLYSALTICVLLVFVLS